MAINEEKLKKYIKMGCESTEKESPFRQGIFNKILDALGWDEEQITYEKEIPIGNGRILSADYELTRDDIKYVVEAKSPRVSVDNYFSQLTSYIKQEEAKLGFVYNGKKLALFVRNLGSAWSEDPAYVWECGQDIDVFMYLSPEKIGSIESDFLERTRNERLLDQSIQDNISTVKNKATEILRNATGLDAEYIENSIDMIIKSPRIQVSSSLSNSNATTNESDHHTQIERMPNEEISGNDDDDVVVCPASGEQNDNIGERWMLRYNAWRSVVMKKTPKYIALYQGFPYSQVRLFAEIDKIFDSGDQRLQSEYGLPPADNSDSGKKTLILKPESIKLLDRPIEKASWGGFRNIKYTKIGKLKQARSIEDL